MKPTSSMLALRSSHSFLTSSLISPLATLQSRSRPYATQTGLGTSASSTARRRKVTAFNDDGFVPWNELSAGEKASRATQQSFNLGMILVGVVLTASRTIPLLRYCRLHALTPVLRGVSASSYGMMSSLQIVRRRSSTGRSVR